MEQQWPPVSTVAPDEFQSEEDERMLLDFFRILNADWTLQESHVENNFKVYYQYTEDSPLVLIRGECDVPAPVSKVIDFIHSYDDFGINYSIIDTMCTRAEVVTAMDPKHKINYGQFGVPKPASDRDFLWRNYSTVLPNGDAVCLAHSTELDSHPADDGLLGYVRGHIKTSGYYVEHVKGDDERCVLHFIVQADPKGWLPVWAINWCASNQAYNAKRTAEHFSKISK